MHKRVDSELESDGLSLKVELISNNPVVHGLLHLTGGLLAVLDDRRRVLTINDALLRWLGLGSAQQVLGLRHGDVFHCVHAHDAPGGCGEGPFCQNCGAAIATVLSLTDELPVERTCAILSQRDGTPRDLYLRVHSCPLRIDGQRILLLFLQDITAEQQACAVQRVFFHDVANTVSALSVFSESMLRRSDPASHSAAGQVASLVRRLHMEICMQRALIDPEHFVFRECVEPIAMRQLLQDLAGIIEIHPCSRDKRLVLPSPVPETELRTDVSVLMRVLTNAVVNAMEGTDTKGEARLSVDVGSERVSICVWNHQAMDEQVARRIFQRNFSTKAALGRGLGTYSMKLFTERFLRGSVSFTTSAAEGTTFRIMLSRNG